MNDRVQGWTRADVLGSAWESLKQHAAVLVGACVVADVVGSLPELVAPMLVRGHTLEPETTALTVVELCGSLLGFLIATTLGAGVTRIALDAADGDSPEFSSLWGELPRAPAFVGAALLLVAASSLPFAAAVIAVMLGMPTVVGLIIAIVGFAVCHLGFSLAPFYVIDQRVGPVEAMGASWRATRGHKFGLFSLAVLLALLAVPVVIFTCGLGLLVYVPFMALVYADVYLRLARA